MSGTPETDDIARGNHVVPVEWAEQLERERDEAREHFRDIAEYGTEEINAAVELRQKLATALLERDEARERYATEATEHMLSINRICNERDEAVEEGRRLTAILDLIKKEAQ